MDDIVSVMPNGADSNGLIVVNLKRKLSYRGYVYFESVRTEFFKLHMFYFQENAFLPTVISSEKNKYSTTIRNNQQPASLLND